MPTTALTDPSSSLATERARRAASTTEPKPEAAPPPPTAPTTTMTPSSVEPRTTPDPLRQHEARRMAAGRESDVAARFGDVPSTSSSTDHLAAVRDGSRILRPGDHDPAVSDLQRALNKAGAHLEVDGHFDPATERAVKSYQRARGIGVDGAVGRETMAWLSPAPSTTAPTAPTVTSHVGHLAPGELQRLKTSSDPADRRRAITVERTQSAYADHMREGGRVLVSTSAGNGGHPVVTLVPPGFDPSKPATVQTHYHGFNATVADGSGHSSGTTRAIAAAQRNDPQAIFVLPEASNARAGSYATDWSNVRSQSQTTNDALRGAGVDRVGERVVSAHSGGGAAIANAMQAQRDGSGVQADRLVLHDSLYGSENAVAAWARTASGRSADVTYVRGTNDAGRDAPIGDAFRGRYHRVNVGGANAHNRAIFEHLNGR
jgi:peptidoglycan hydrolase-like protein with peptidoglycan-binding domain